MYCRNCAAEVAENAEICTKCGVRPLNASKFCQNCGGETKPEQELCVKCGVRLQSAAMAARAAAQAPGRVGQ